MKSGRQKTGLNVIKEKPLLNQQFAIMNKMKQDIENQIKANQEEQGHNLVSIESS